MKYYRNDKKIKKSYVDIVNEFTNNIQSVKSEEVNLFNANNRVSYCDIKAKKDIPLFNKSPFDGYCFKSIDSLNVTKGNYKQLKVIDRIYASKISKKTIKENECIKLMTGSKIPNGADCITKFEEVKEDKDTICIYREYKKNENVILRGEEIATGDIIVNKGKAFEYGTLGACSSLNIHKVKVFKKIKINLISTGSELLEIGEKEKDGLIYNSSRYIISAFLEKFGFDVNYLGIIKDDFSELNKTIKQSMLDADVTITTGGVSVGDFDYLASVFKNLKINMVSNATNLKPGMSSIYGYKKNKLLMSLSGNPISAFTNLLMIVLPIIRKMQGFNYYQNKIIKVKLINDVYVKPINCFRILMGKIVYEKGDIYAKISEKQGNSIITSLIDTCFYPIIHPNTNAIKKGEFIEGVII